MDTLFGVFITRVVAIGVLGILALVCVYAIDGLFRISDRELEKRSKEDVGIVIATNGYTKSAKSLASANNIKLIHHSEIKAL